jgi:hypothetical protein
MAQIQIAIHNYDVSQVLLLPLRMRLLELRPKYKAAGRRRRGDEDVPRRTKGVVLEAGRTLE